MRQHRLLMRWACDVVEHLLEELAVGMTDDRPQRAIAVGRQWADGVVKTGVAMKAALAAHAAAREADFPAWAFVARAAGHAVATAHAADHCMGAMIYAIKAWHARDQDPRPFWNRHRSSMPEEWCPLMVEGILARLPRRLLPLLD
jgi:hypothetical protein